MDELRAIAGYAVACAEPELVLFQKARPDDPRPAAALHAARVFAEGAPRSSLQRTAATDAHRAAKDDRTEAAQHAASAAGDAASAAYLHPLAKATQVRHILGSAAHAARAAELARGDDPVVAEYVITAAAKRAMPVVLDVLNRYPRAPKGRSRESRRSCARNGARSRWTHGGVDVRRTVGWAWMLRASGLPPARG